MNRKWLRTIAVILGLMILSSVAGYCDTSVMLDIPWQHQWLNDGGYCGETAIKDAALLYGTYISQEVAREYGGGEVIVGCEVDAPYGNASAVYDKLKLTYDRWNYNSGTPQYKKFLNWTKWHLNEGHPVLFGAYLSDCSDEDFDHIIPAIGFTAESVYDYSDNDTITMYDNFLPAQSYTRTFGSFFDDRSMQGNGSDNYMCLPKDVDYGDAITGIVDQNHETYPVKLSVDVYDEPNVSQGASPVLMNAAITVSGLQSGESYMLLRYNDYESIPTHHFKRKSSQAAKVVTFVATDTTYTMNDTIMSDTMAAYRCVSN